MTVLDADSFRDAVAGILEECRTASLATVGPDGGPHAANIQFAHDQGFRLYWVSSPASAHSEHLGQRDGAAITIYAHDDRPTHIHGLQMHGRARVLLPGRELQDARERYLRRFSFIAQTPKLLEILDSQRFYRFTPTWIRLIDNRRGFGFKQEQSL